MPRNSYLFLAVAYILSISLNELLRLLSYFAVVRYKLVALLSFVTLIGLSQSLPIIPQPQQVMLSGDSVAIGKFKGLTFRLPYLFDKYNDEAYHLVITKDTLYAEALWTKSDRKDFKDFEQRLNSFQPK